MVWIPIWVLILLLALPGAMAAFGARLFLENRQLRQFRKRERFYKRLEVLMKSVGMGV
jgi:hypothetical protein